MPQFSAFVDREAQHAQLHVTFKRRRALVTSPAGATMLLLCFGAALPWFCRLLATFRHWQASWDISRLDQATKGDCYNQVSTYTGFQTLMHPHCQSAAGLVLASVANANVT